MAVTKTVNVETTNARASTTLTDTTPTVPLPDTPQGLMVIGPQVTLHFVEDEWNQANSYDYYDVVQVDGTSYIAVQDVPANTPITNTEYWAKWNDPNAQVELLQQTVSQFDGRIADNTENIANITSNIVTPEMHGAAGDGVTDDTKAVQDAFNEASKSRKILILSKCYNVPSGLTLNTANTPYPVTVIGSNHSTFAVNSDGVNQDNVNLKLGNSSITISGIANVFMQGVGLQGTGTAIIMNGYRSTVHNCMFSGFNIAIKKQSSSASFNGENKINGCLFIGCNICLQSEANSTDDIVSNCIAHSTCTNFITGSIVGYMVNSNHDYSENGSDISGSGYLISNNYFDGVNKLKISGNGPFTIVGNQFVIPNFSGNASCITFSSNANNGCIVGNSVIVIPSSNQPVENLAFIDITSVQYFNYVTIKANNTRNCSKLINGATSKNLYNVNLDASNSFTILSSGYTLIKSSGYVSGAAVVGSADIAIDGAVNPLVGSWSNYSDSYVHDITFFNGSTYLSSTKIYGGSQVNIGTIPPTATRMIIQTTGIRGYNGESAL